MRITHLTRECPVQYDQGFPGTMHILHILQVCCTHQKSTGTLPSPCFLLFLCLWKVLNDVYQPIAYLWLSCMYLSAYRVHIGCHALSAHHSLISLSFAYQPITTSTLWTLPSPNMGSTFPMNSLPSTVSDLTPLLTWFGLEMLMSYTAPLKYLLTL